MNQFLPKAIQSVRVPPIKCQGIKTKLVPFIARNISWDGKGRWIEPFMGSGVVAFNLRPERAVLADTNKHIIELYNDIKSGKVTEVIVKNYLTEMGNKLLEKGEDFYYEVRDEFNSSGGSLPFLFLNRACFNGLMRFNSKGKFNVPFGRKPERFRKAYVTKITNQVAWVRSILHAVDWEFVVSDYKKIMAIVQANDFVYMDPPYIGRHTDYFNSWSVDDARHLAKLAEDLSCGFALSMWLENKYRRNNHLDLHWNGYQVRTYEHFYHVGSTESLRNSMTEALVIKEGFASLQSVAKKLDKAALQHELFSLPFDK
ncbi:DNA adenine methylase [candidate division KSB1 bacterium 4484_188]|nr:MAG: DNA adenine methylase [candidate division KSB1 bacterium 4484_188]